MEPLPTFIANDVIKCLMFPAILKNIASILWKFLVTRALALEGVNHDYSNRRNPSRPGQHHRQAVLDQFAKIVPPY